MSSTTPRAEFPAEIWIKICSYLDSCTVAALAQVSIKLNVNLQEEVYLAAIRDGNTDIITRCAATGNLATLQRIASHGADMNKAYSFEAPQCLEDWVKLEYRKEWERREVLSDDGIKVALSKACFATPLHLAAKGGHYDTVRWLLDQHSVDMEMPARFLCQCIPPGTFRIPGRVMGQAVPAWTPLHIAICNQKVSVARLLLSRGASSRIVSVGHTSPKYPLFNQVFASAFEGLDPTKSWVPAVVVSALQSAAFSGNGPIIKELVQCMGVDVDEVVVESGATPLYYAITAHNELSVALLRRLGANPERPFTLDRLDVHYDNAFEYALAMEKTDPTLSVFELFSYKVAPDIFTFSSNLAKSNAALHLFSEPGGAWYCPSETKGKIVSRLRQSLSAARPEYWGQVNGTPLAQGLNKMMPDILWRTIAQHEPHFAPLDQEILDCFLIACQCNFPALQPSTLEGFLHASKIHLQKVVDLHAGSKVIEYAADANLPDTRSSAFSDMDVKDDRSEATTCTVGMLALHATVAAFDPGVFLNEDSNEALVRNAKWLITKGASPTITPGVDLKWSPLPHFFDTITQTWDRYCVTDAFQGGSLAEVLANMIKVLGEGGGWFPLGEDNDEAMFSTVRACHAALGAVLPTSSSEHRREFIAEARNKIESCMPPKVFKAWKSLDQ
ncbi:uncharacterized protein CLUP02_11890 [Colletotrichum lupini]|uniref:Ankyrin repeat protein n=1 Tax=Colletotrichum lupini TaxID=145971 RepID=A0A9Q8SZC5_9PEZI|nr:uncharacterized protein CLUP02_11890 [Colletotrichum lupini]UQC86389.1 hypothetical protein CLUP02_11890 [Colletotrichum lupini]